MMRDLRAVLALALGLGCALPLRAPLTQELITHPDLAAGSVSKTEAMLYFTRRLDTWRDGSPVTVFVLGDEHPLHRDFAKQVLGLYPYQLRRTWDRQVFSGTGRAPIEVDSEADLIRNVVTTPGGIGYARSPGADVRVQQVEGN